MLDLIIITVHNRVRRAHLPHGFWQLPEEHRVEYIQYRWPYATYATNGDPDPLKVISHTLTPKEQPLARGRVRSAVNCNPGDTLLRAGGLAVRVDDRARQLQVGDVVEIYHQHVTVIGDPVIPLPRVFYPMPAGTESATSQATKPQTT
jgi:hypothetical protein